MFDVSFRLTCSIQTPCTIYNTIDSVFGHGSEMKDVKNEKQSKIVFYLLCKENQAALKQLLAKTWLVSISVLGFEKFVSQA